MKTEYQLSVVIAVQYAQKNLPEILDNLDPNGHQNVEFLFCYTDADPDTIELVGGYENSRVLLAPSGSLVPHLWRDGIQAAQAEKVALGTAHCIPTIDWIDQLLVTDMTSLPGVGGVLENAESSDAKGWAVYLLRYISFAPPQQKRPVNEIAADNAIYRHNNTDIQLC